MKSLPRSPELEGLTFEREALKQGYQQIAGIDEAGRGPLAGPVVACACIPPLGVVYDGVTDSKKLTRAKRKALYRKLTQDSRLKFGIGVVGSDVIDQINILQATIKAMLEAACQLETDYLLVDGLQLPHPSLPCLKLIKGDLRCHAIACASVIAKEYRDQLMENYAAQYPGYHFERHMGYGTALHKEALAEHGPCPIHRYSFSPIQHQFRIRASPGRAEGQSHQM